MSSIIPLNGSELFCPLFRYFMLTTVLFLFIYQLIQNIICS